MSAKQDTIKVWDPLVRIAHWTLVAAFFVAYFTEDDLLTQHVWAGYTVAGVVLIRIVWGFVGTRNARFGSFVRSPGVTLRYLGDIATHRAKRYVGHNPAGGAMIVALIASLAVTTFSGLEIYAIEENAGPLAVLSGQSAREAPMPAWTGSAYADEDHDSDGDRHGGGYRDEQAEEFWEEVHEVAANFTLFLIVLHVGGVLLASVSHRDNLVKAMFTGRKRNASNQN